MPAAYDPPDYLLLDELLTDEERLVAKTVREFVDDRVIPIIADCFMAEKFPTELVPELAALGLLGAGLKGYGCAGLSSIAYGLLLQELERGDSGLRSFVSVQSSLAMYAIHRFGSEEQKNRWLPQMAQGKLIGCFGLTEPDFGSNPAGMQTSARLDGEHYVLNGNKMWITNGSIADLAIVWAKENDEIRGFVVEKGSPGYSTTLQKGKWSLRASVTAELHFADCRIPKENRLPEASGLRGPLSCLNQARFGISWGALGAAMACYSEAREYSQTRIQFGKPIGAFQLVQEKLANMLTEITKGQLLAFRVAQLKDAGKVRPQMISMAKRNNVDIALRVAREARDMLGANGVTHEYPVGRHMANLESVRTYEGTHDIHALILGQDITGFDAFH